MEETFNTNLDWYLLLVPEQGLIDPTYKLDLSITLFFQNYIINYNGKSGLFGTKTKQPTLRQHDYLSKHWELQT